MEGSKIANPGPLGLAGFAMTTFILSMVNSNLVGVTSTGGAVALAFAYGGLVQLLAGMWEFRTGNTFGAVAFSSFGAFWLAFFVISIGAAGAISSHGVRSGFSVPFWKLAYNVPVSRPAVPEYAALSKLRLMNETVKHFGGRSEPENPLPEFYPSPEERTSPKNGSPPKIWAEHPL